MVEIVKGFFNNLNSTQMTIFPLFPLFLNNSITIIKLDQTLTNLNFDHSDHFKLFYHSDFFRSFQSFIFSIIFLLWSLCSSSFILSGGWSVVHTVNPETPTSSHKHIHSSSTYIFILFFNLFSLPLYLFSLYLSSLT
jgi:hypothetical protein